MVPLAIVHGRNDPVQDFAMSRYAARVFGDQGWPGVRLFTSETAAHMFMLLPVGEAIRWLEAMASDDPEVLAAFAEKQAAAGHHRDAIAALRTLRGLKQTDAQKERADRVRAAVVAKAKAGSDEFLPRIRENKDGSWVDGFLAFRDEFAFADAARPAMEAFEALRRQQEPAARKAFEQGLTLLRQGKTDDGYAKYREIAEKYYASSRYRQMKDILAARK